jgi:hypothetical protein
MAGSCPGERPRDLQRYAAQSGQIKPEVRAGALEAAMPENVTDGLDTYTTSQEPHGERVSQAVCTTAERRQPCLSRSLVQDVADSESRQRAVRAACAVKQCWMVDRSPCLIVLQIISNHPERWLPERQDEL